MSKVRHFVVAAAVAATLSPLASTRLRAAEGAAPPHVDESTRKMEALLRERAGLVNPARVGFPMNDVRAALLGEQLRHMPLSMQRLDTQLLFATELLYAGRIQDCLMALDAGEADAKRLIPPQMLEKGRPNILMLRAAAYMRMAEDQNCCQLNNRDSCLLPIRGGGIHQKREGATRAIETLKEVLAIQPDHLQARWLLNLAYMSIGEYPDAVPPAQLIPPAAFASEAPFPRFDNVAKEAGLDLLGLSGGAILEDFDNDGRLDLMVGGVGFTDQTRVFFNKGDGTFEDRTDRAGILGEYAALNMSQADYDNDGFVDVMLLRGGWAGDQGMFPSSLLHNNGNGTFTDVTEAAGLLSLGPSQNATWFDYDGDGWLDLFQAEETTSKEKTFPCHLFHNNHDGTFTDVAHEVGLDLVGYVKAATAGDYDGDGRPDLYVSVHTSGNRLFHNDGPTPGKPGSWHFSDVTQKAGVPGPKMCFGTFFFDYDNDGRLDLFVSAFTASKTVSADVAADYLGLPAETDRNRLYHNEGDGTFKDVTKEAGLYRIAPTMGNNVGDLDNDGFPDIFLGTGNPDFTTLIPKRLFWNDGGKRFRDVTTAANVGHLQKGHGVAIGDVDNDGDLDIFAQMGGAYLADKGYSALFENPGNANAWIGVELHGVKSNRKGVGARIKVTVDTKEGPRSIYRLVNSGSNYGGSPLDQLIGVGRATRVSSLEVFWPVTGRTQKVEGLQLKRWYEIKEDADKATELKRPASTPRKALRAPTAPTGKIVKDAAS